MMDKTVSHSKSLEKVAASLLFGLVLVLTAVFLVKARGAASTTPYFKISYDAQQYIKLAHGESAPAPFSHRLLAPVIARLLPWKAERSLSLITYAAMVLNYVILLGIMSRIGISSNAAYLGCLWCYPSLAHQIIFQNPHLPDALSLCFMSGLILALLSEAPSGVAMALMVGVCARESILCLSPAVFSLKRKGVALVISALMCLTVFVLYAFAPTAGSVISPPTSLAKVVVKALLSWGAVWLSAALGCILLLSAGAYRLVLCFLLLAGGASISAIIATDTVRMFAVLFPAMVIASAALIDRLLESKPSLVLTGILVNLLWGGLWVVPTQVSGSYSTGISRLEEYFARAFWAVAVSYALGLIVTVLWFTAAGTFILEAAKKVAATLMRNGSADRETPTPDCNSIQNREPKIATPRIPNPRSLGCGMLSNGRGSIIGILIDAVDYKSAVDRIIQAAHEHRPMAISALAVHGLMTGVLHRDYKYRLNHFDLLVPDGQPVRWALNLLHGARLQDRVYGPNLMLALCSRAEEEGLGVFLYGSTHEVLCGLRMSLGHRFPSLRIAGMEPSKFRRLSAEKRIDLIARIRSAGAAIVFVGLGCPRQEVWAYELREALSTPLVAVGAAFPFFAGTVRQAPKWMQDRGLEWLFRLIAEPRLWRRYLFLNPLYVFLVTLQLCGLTHFSTEGDLPCPELYG